VTLVVDGLNGSKIDTAYLAEVAESGPTPLVLHVTVNNLRRIIPDPSLEDALVDLAAWRRFIRSNDTRVSVIRQSDDWDDVGNDGAIGLILGYQNSNFVGESLDLLEVLHDLDVRVMQLTHNGVNQFGSGCASDRDEGLTDLGREFVETCNRIGMALDFAHTGDRTTVDAARASSRPVLITHANAKAVTSHRRNKSDEALRAVAESGGVVGLCFFPPLLTNDGTPTISNVLDHFEHVYRVVGEDSVAFGSDFITNQDHGDRYSALRQQKSMYDMDNLVYPLGGIQEMPRLAEAIASRGYSERTVEKFMGDNFRRAFQEVMG